MMPEEWFDVVDANDRVVARAARSTVHRDGLRHRAVHILVVNGAGAVFLQRRAWSKDSHPGTWDSSASGHVDAGEDYVASAVREVEEELGIRIEAATLNEIDRLEASPATDLEFVRVYLMRHEGPFALNAAEILEGAFVEPAEVMRRIRDEPASFARAFRTLFRRAAAHLAAAVHATASRGA